MIWNFSFISVLFQVYFGSIYGNDKGMDCGHGVDSVEMACREECGMEEKNKKERVGGLSLFV